MHAIRTPYHAGTDRRVRVLIAARDPVVGALLGVLATREGFTAVQADAPWGAVATYERMRPHFVLLAVPKWIDAAELLRRAERDGVTVVRCTAGDGTSDAAGWPRALPVLRLPVSAASLRSVVARRRTSPASAPAPWAARRERPRAAG